MKKSLIALAVMAAAGAASAQSSVTLFGVVDATLAWGKGDVSDKFALANSGYNSSRLGFRGTEDLGGGMTAGFWLEMGFNNDDGTGANTSSTNQPIGAFNPATGANAPVRSGTQGLTFNRRSFVSLAGGWGEVRLGREYTPQFMNLTVFDPFGYNGVGTTAVAVPSLLGFGANDTTGVRASNSIGYWAPGNLGGFYGQAMMWLGENNSGATEDDGTGYGLRVGFASGPFNAAFAYSRTNFLAGDLKTWNVGGQWDFGMFKLMGHYQENKLNALKGDGWLIGGLIPVGAGEIRLSYSTYEANTATGHNVDKYAIGYVHNLSKRTALYATYAHLNNGGGAAASLNGAVTAVNGNSSGFDLGIRHSF